MPMVLQSNLLIFLWSLNEGCHILLEGEYKVVFSSGETDLLVATSLS